MRQVIYISTAATGLPGSATGAILDVSRRNNAQDGITGLLYFNGKRFLQALEGDADQVGRALERIGRDPRHRAIVILSDREVAEPEFGAWAMAHQAPGKDAAALLGQVTKLVAGASPSVQATFTGFVDLRHAA